MVPTGWRQLDEGLPGGGWSSQSLTDVLSYQPAVIEWRLLAPELRQLCSRGGQIVTMAPPRQPYLPGLQQEGLDERRFVWIEGQAPAEQLIKANNCGAVVAWLLQTRAE